MVSAVAMAATLSVTSLAAGCNNNGHTHAPNWVTDREATCTEQGYRTGTCVCGDVIGEYIPIDPDAHAFDEEWDITEYPTETKKGRAVRTCKYNPEHEFTATLPEITEAGTGYVSSQPTKKPTIISTGIRHFVYAHEAGAVEFDIVLPKREAIETVEDVVILATSLHDNIRSSAGDYVYGDPEGTDVKKHNFSNYYGDNYTRVHDEGDKRDFWYSLDDKGNPFGISAEVQRVMINAPGDGEEPPEGWVAEFEEIRTDPRIDESASVENLLGYGYASGGGMRRTYGAEDTLLTYYEASQSDGAIKYATEEPHQNNDGGYTCQFSFSRKEQTHFCRYTVNFTTFPTGEIKTLSVRTKIIRTFMLANTFNGSNGNEVEIIYGSDGDVIFSEIYPISTATGEEMYETSTDAEGNEYIVTNGVKTKPDGSPLLDRFGNDIVRPVPQGWHEGDEKAYYYEEGDKKADGSYYESDHEYIAIRIINFEQTLKTDEDEVEENPYSSESVYIQSFDVKYNGKVITEDDKVEITANTSVTFSISNVEPADTAKLDFDPLSVYLKTASGETQLSYTGEVQDFEQNAYHIVGYFNATNKTVHVNAQYKGELTLVLRPRGGRCERTINLVVKAGNPSKLNAQAYLYSDADGVEKHEWADLVYEEADSVIDLYVGQSVYVRGLPLASEEAYVDGGFTTSVSRTYSTYISTEDEMTLPDGTKVSKITALAPTTGTFEPVIEFNVNSVNLKSSGEPVAYTRVQVRISEAPSVSDMFTGTYKGKFSRIRMVEGGKLGPADVTATFNSTTANSGTVEILVSDGTTSARSVYNYTYDAANRTLSCVWASGKENTDTFDFDIKLNEVYKISITHTTFEGRNESVVLTKQS